MTDNLQHAEQLLREGRKQEAQNVLMEYVQGHPSSARAWWLLSFALTDPKQQMECLVRVLQIDAGNIPARTRLLKLKSDIAPQSVSPSFEQSPARPETPHSYPAAAPFLTEADSAPQPVRSAPKRPVPKKKTNWALPIAVLSVFLCAMTAIVIGFVFVLRDQQEASAFLDSPTLAVSLSSPTIILAQTLPPTWTPVATTTPIPANTFVSRDATPTLAFTVLGTEELQFGSGFSLGSPAPDFKLKNANTGNQVSLSDFQSRPVIIFFWANGCGLCETEAQALQKIYKDYKDDGLVILAVDVWGDSEHARSFRDAHDLTYSMLTDPKGNAFKLYNGTNWFPVNYFIDSSGNISSYLVGMMDYSMLNINARVLLNLIPTAAP
jgi:peroxiredoxin